MTTMFKTTPLSGQWATRNQARETSLIISGKDDQMNAEGLYVEQDDQMSYMAQKERRFSKSGLNAYKADGDLASLEDELICESCMPTPAGQRAERRLIALGYNINGDFDAIRASNAQWFAQDIDEVE
jgi:hypothetical protein